MLYNIMEMLRNLKSDALNAALHKFPRLEALEKRIGELPGMKAYIKQRPETEF